VRILLVSGSYPPIKCGIGEYTSLLANALVSQRDISVGVLTSSEANPDSAADSVDIMPLIDRWSFSRIFLILKSVREWHPELIHIQYPTKGYGRCKMPVFLPLIFGLKGIPVVQTWHEPLSLLRGVKYLPCALTKDSFVTVEPAYRALIPGFVWKILSRKRFLRYIPVGAMIPKVELTNLRRESIKNKFDAADRNLLVYFGFVIAAKGVEKLFQIANPVTDRLVLLCDLDPENQCHREIITLMESEEWTGKVFSTGFLPAEEAAEILAAADAAIFPFNTGMTRRNTSVYAAQAQGTFVLTTSRERYGYDQRDNSYYARPGDLDAMRQAIRRYSGVKASGGQIPDWQAIAAKHAELYKEILTENAKED